MATEKKTKTKEDKVWTADSWETNPSALLGDPLGDVLREDEVDNKSDNVWEEASDPTLNDRHCDTIAEAEQSQHSTPRYTTVAE